MTRKGRSRSPLVVALLGLTGGVGLLAVGATLGALAAEWWWPLDLLTSFHLHYAVVLGAIALIHLALRSPGIGYLLLVVALVNVSIIAPYVVGSSAPRAEGPEISVLSFNVGVSNPMRQEIAEYAAAEQPDVLFIIESSFEWEDALAKAGPAMSAIAIVPRGQVSGITVLADPDVLPRSISLDFAEPEEAAAVEVSIGDERVIVLAIHPPSPVRSHRAARRNQLLAAAGDWVGASDQPVLVVGDFNATPWSPAYRSLEVRGNLVDTARWTGIQPTWPSGWGLAMIPIDHALHTPDLVAVERSTGPSLGSAHRPLLVKVAFAG